MTNRFKGYLYRKLSEGKLSRLCPSQVVSGLRLLYPGKDEKELCADYLYRKLSLVVMILAVGMVFGIAARIMAQRGSALDGDGSLTRGSFQDGTEQIRLTATYQHQKIQLDVELHPRELTDEEVDMRYEEFCLRLDDLILAENSDRLHITSDLSLERNFDGYPFDIEWRSDRPDILDPLGAVNRVKEAVPVNLSMLLTYGTWQKTESFAVTVVPPLLSEEEAFRENLEEYIQTLEEQDRDAQSMQLPSQWDERAIVWKIQGEDYSLFVWALTPIVAILIYFCTDRDLQQRLEQRKNDLRAEYPGVVHKLVLLLGAGLSVRKAFERMGQEYEKQKEMTGLCSPGAEEIMMTCRQLQSGVTESAAYIQLGKRAGIREYIGLSTLLVQNQKRGNDEMLSRIMEEAARASGEKLLFVKKLGEEAGTKILIPMVMLLAVIMIIIMIPAFGVM